MTLKKPLRVAGALVLTALATASVAASARAAEGDPFLDSCLTGTAVTGCTTDEFVDGPFASAISQDGSHVYVGVIGGGGGTRGTGIVQFDRTASGALVRHPGIKGCVTDNGNPTSPPSTGRRCTVGNDLGPASGMHVVGNTLYFTTLINSALLVFDIDPATGELTQKASIAGCIRNGPPSGGCEGATGFTAPGAMAHKADGSELYVRTSYGLALFNRAADGTLAQEAAAAACWHEDPIGTCSDGAGLASGLAAIRQIAVVGDNLYVPFGDSRDVDNTCPPNNCQAPDFNGGVGVFSINADGTLAQAAHQTRCVSNNGESGIGDDIECTITGRESYVFSSVVTGAGDDVYLGHFMAVDHFRRGAGGVLVDSDAGAAGHQPADCVGAGPGCTAANPVTGASWLGLSPDGSELVVASVPNVALGFLRRDAGTGKLTQRADPADCVSRTGAGGCQTIAALSTPATIAFAPDSLTLYSTGQDHDSIVAIDRDFAPACQNGSADAAFNTSVAVTLSCTDPNGDALTLEITQQPVNGTLAAIDQANGSVRYSPALGFSGPDRFTFRARSRGGAVNSAPAEVNLTVAAPPQDNDRDGVSPPADCDDSNAAVRPGAAEVPGNGIDEDCLNGDQKLPAGRVASGVDFFFDARNLRFTKVGRLDVTSIPAGATLQVRCIGGKKKGCRFKSKKRTFTKATVKFNAKRYFNFTKKVNKKKRKIVSRLKKGTKIEIRVTKAGMIGKVVTFTTRRGKTPTFVVSCLPVGSTKPQRTC